MKSHVFRPLLVVIGIVCIILAVRMFYVPKDFGVHGTGYMYGWYRENNIRFWKDVKVKYQGNEYCKDCHAENYESIMTTPHAIIPCEDCHGPAGEHPSEPQKLALDKSRGLCLRCHSLLPYPTSGRSKIRGVDPDTHNPDVECVMCHSPHKPTLEGLK